MVKLVVFSRMNMASDDVLAFDTTYDNCYIQSDVSPCDQHAYKPYVAEPPDGAIMSLKTEPAPTSFRWRHP